MTSFNPRSGFSPFRKLALPAAVSLLAVATSVSAQDEAGNRAALEEVVVTGTKRDVSQQDLPIAVSTITASQLNKTFQNSVTELAQFAPNVTLTPQNGFNAIAGGMRGTGTGQNGCPLRFPPRRCRHLQQGSAWRAFPRCHAARFRR